MARRTPLIQQRWLWTALVGGAAAAFWVVGLGVGWRAWILAPTAGGIVAHAQAFGTDASLYWIPASVLTLTAAVMAIGLSVVRHLVDGPVDSVPEQPTLPELAPAPTESPVDEVEAQSDVSDG